MRRLLAALLVLLGCPVLYAQGPAADWRTIETAHFRVHYPREYEEWAMRAAERLESIRVEVSQEVGFTPPQTIDVLVMNPIAQPNGSAWPLLDTPRMIFFTEPPGPDEQLGAYGHWIDLLAVHETAHLVHMLRPSRNPLQRLLEKFVLPFNPITLRAPRWVLEGYATVIEGRLTGAGRPTSTIRALILRRWAENGRLPSYGQLDSDQRFLGMSMAYLMGSAYLEWLEQRSSPDALRNLWARMTARQRRSFDDAFAGVFGERPDRLYGQFVAELTASAIAIRKARELHEGALFQETPRASGDPAVSPDGTQIAVVIRAKDKPEKLVIWSTAEASEEETKYEERVERMLARDPEDVAPVRTKPLPRKAVHELTMPDGGDIRTPRWTRDGKAIIFAHRVPDAEGGLHFDLYRWDFENLARITHLADVRDADPIDERTAVALRSRHGASQLVSVDLASGEVTPRGEASIDHVIATPRVSPDGTRIAHVAHRGGRWALFVDDAPIALPGDPASPAWLSNDELVVTVFAGGFAELHRVTLDGTATPITRTAGGAFDAAACLECGGKATDFKSGGPAAALQKIFYTSLDPDGYVVRVLTDGAPASLRSGQALPADLSPAIPALPRTPPTFTAQSLGSPRPYGIGRQEFSWLASQNFAPDYRATELGVRLGDVVGRLDTLLIASFGDTEGVALASAWRGWPVEVHGHAFHSDGESNGELRGVWSRRFPRSRLTVEGGALTGAASLPRRSAPIGAPPAWRPVRRLPGGETAGRLPADRPAGSRRSESRDDYLIFASAAFSTRQHLGALRFEEGARVEVDDEHHRIVLAGAVRAGSLRIGARVQRDRGSTVTLGGVASSILPRSAYAMRVLDPALPVAILSGGEYDGWRIESTVPGLPFTAFYQRHELGARRLSIAGAEIDLGTDPMPVLKFPGLDLTLGAARILDEPLRGETKWWLAARWRP